MGEQQGQKQEPETPVDAARAAGLTLDALEAVARQPLLGGLCETAFAARADEDGTVAAAELRALCMGLGVRLSDAELADARRALDPAGTGRVAWEAFRAWWAAQERFAPLRAGAGVLAVLRGVLAAFAAGDTDGDGVLARADFAPVHAALCACGCAAAPDAQANWDAVDRAHTGRIAYNDFVAWLLARAAAADSQH